ncbi:hypothetical protein E5Q_00425 [Mixia osmundae IAM 14324]|uniref:DUF300-domain-containing protein n=1 Tax=Mixia osmundae (strain CBS 9802 / IAM 14324 / JCM 22182 / KY 12970) TaxID=764103 RepID=G7DTD2_MIXOS|nr:hypothetical protein E5Q_00425 [Mixia osmundae IAM 14324]
MAIDLSETGSGSHLPPLILWLATLSALFSTALSIWTIQLQLKNYRKVSLQRWVVRILVMVPIYSIASAVSLYSLDAAFFIDAIRDIYEAFVIYCFFSLLVEYLGGERSLIILLHGREPTPHPWPVSVFLEPMDISDPYTFLALKRGILQYVQIKPVLAILTMLLKAVGSYGDGQLKATNGYTYISVVYNISITLCLYCLAMFWVCLSHDIQPFRPLPKFLCVKGIVFATFWQGFMLSILVSSGVISSPSYTKETLSIALQDSLIAFEMPFFAILHLYAFSHKDYIDKHNQYAGRLPVIYALRDSLLGYKDVMQDSLTTVRGTGFSYRTFEPAEGGLHQGQGRDRRVLAGLRYAKGGKQKYWLPMPGQDVGEAYGRRPAQIAPGVDDGESKALMTWHNAKHPIAAARRIISEARRLQEGYAPISPEQASNVVHRDSSASSRERPETAHWEQTGIDGNVALDESDSDASELGFDKLGEEEETLYREAKKLEFGDYNFPVLDASRERARREMRQQEDALIYGRRHRHKARRNSSTPQRPPIISRNSKTTLLGNEIVPEEASSSVSGSSLHSQGSSTVAKGKAKQKEPLPEGCIDLLVEDAEEEEEEESRIRRKGEPNFRAGHRKKVFRRQYRAPSPPARTEEETGFVRSPGDTALTLPADRASLPPQGEASPKTASGPGNEAESKYGVQGVGNAEADDVSVASMHACCTANYMTMHTRLPAKHRALSLSLSLSLSL